MRLIDADALLDDCVFSSKAFEKTMREFIGDAPTVELEQKKGRWEQQTESMGAYEVECAVCSVCKNGFDLREGYSIEDIRELFAYCPSCGAKMEE